MGSGLSGLATAWHLLHLPNPPTVTLYSNGKEASRISAGLLHKYMGQYAKLNPLAVEGEQATLALLASAQEFSSQPLILSQGFIRPATSDRQAAAYKECAAAYGDVDWLETCRVLDPNGPPCPGLFIQSGLVIDTPAYLNALIEGCKSRGLIIQEHTIELAAYDYVIQAMGAYTPVPLHPLKGQLLEIEWPSIPPLPFTIVGPIYIAMTKDRTRAVIGATYEHSYENEEPNSFAIDYLYPRAVALYPLLEGAKVVDVKAGLRASMPNRMPLVKKISDNRVVITGMGSRGLLYHSLFAKQCAALFS